MHIVRSYLCDRWQEGGERRPLINPSNDERLAEAGSSGLDLGDALAHARDHGGATLRKMTFAQRGALLASIATSLHKRREDLVALSIANGGNTRGDAKFDIDGATGTLSYYAKLGERLGHKRTLVDGAAERLAPNPRYVGYHLQVPRRGVAVHINAFNFPAWGLFEKAAVSILAGVPVFTKPATATALVAERAVEFLVEDGVLPKGVLSLLCGSAGDLLDHLDVQDVVAFTGSADTGARIRGHACVVERSVGLNIEADSLNAAVLGADVDSDSGAYELFLREVARDVTQKAGQKCTATRRVLIPADRLDEVREDLTNEIDNVRVGDPSLREVRMGPVTNRAQLADVEAGMAALEKSGAERVHGGGRGKLVAIEGDQGCFIAPSLFVAPADNPVVHSREVFGPTATLLPYDGTADAAVDILSRGKGSLVSSVYTDDKLFAEGVVLEAAAFMGRIHVGSSRVAEHSPGPGTVMPQMVHGGPGRAGGGEELGGLRGLAFYSQRTGVQGEKTLLEKILPMEER